MSEHPSWQSIVENVAATSVPRGLDLIQPFRASVYNNVVEPQARLKTLDRKDALGILIGNTRAIWDPFVEAMRASDELFHAQNPLDAYVMSVVEGAVAGISERHLIRWAHKPEPTHLPMQRLAQAVGLAQLSPTFLCVHRTHGPWIALRAVVVVDVDGPESTTNTKRLCDPCNAACKEAFRRATEAQGRVEEHWKLWLAVRDACPIGVASRYSDDQIRYHYTKDTEWLRRIIRAS